MNFRVALVCLAATSVATAAAAQTRKVSSTQSPATQVEGDEAEEKKICKSFGITGTNVPVKKSCLTQAGWDARTRDGRDMLEGWRQNSAMINCIPETVKGVTSCIRG